MKASYQHIVNPKTFKSHINDKKLLKLAEDIRRQLIWNVNINLFNIMFKELDDSDSSMAITFSIEDDYIIYEDLKINNESSLNNITFINGIKKTFQTYSSSINHQLISDIIIKACCFKKNSKLNKKEKQEYIGRIKVMDIPNINKSSPNNPYFLIKLTRYPNNYNSKEDYNNLNQSILIKLKIEMNLVEIASIQPRKISVIQESKIDNTREKDKSKDLTKETKDINSDNKDIDESDIILDFKNLLDPESQNQEKNDRNLMDNNLVDLSVLNKKSSITSKNQISQLNSQQISNNIKKKYFVVLQLYQLY